MEMCKKLRFKKIIILQCIVAVTINARCFPLDYKRVLVDFSIINNAF